MNTELFEVSNPSCIKARLRCDKIQYGEGNLWIKTRLALHLVHCKHCRRYSSCNYKLTKLMETANLEGLQPDERAVLKKRLKKETG